MMQVYVEKDFQIITCGSINDKKDDHGNDIYEAVNVVDGVTDTFYDRGAAEHWLKLCGMNRGRN